MQYGGSSERFPPRETQIIANEKNIADPWKNYFHRYPVNTGESVRGFTGARGSGAAIQFLWHGQAEQRQCAGWYRGTRTDRREGVCTGLHSDIPGDIGVFAGCPRGQYGYNGGGWGQGWRHGAVPDRRDCCSADWHLAQRHECGDKSDCGINEHTAAAATHTNQPAYADTHPDLPAYCYAGTANAGCDIGDIGDCNNYGNAGGGHGGATGGCIRTNRDYSTGYKIEQSSGSGYSIDGGSHPGCGFDRRDCLLGSERQEEIKTRII